MKIFSPEGEYEDIMSNLHTVAANTTTRKQLVSELTSLIAEEVKRTSGMTGFAVKGGYKVVSSLKGGQMIPIAVNSLLDQFIDGIEPLTQRFTESSETDFARFMKLNERDAVNALLAVTDRRARTASSAVQGAYQKLRPLAERQVSSALPEVGRLLGKYLV